MRSSKPALAAWQLRDQPGLMRPCLKHKIINVLWLTQDDPSTGLFSNPGGNCNELSLSILILRHPSKSCLEQGEKKNCLWIGSFWRKSIAFNSFLIWEESNYMRELSCISSQLEISARGEGIIKNNGICVFSIQNDSFVSRILQILKS